MLTTLSRRCLALALPLVALQACATTTPQARTAAQPVAVAAVAPPTTTGPALWKVADEDTTIYLFGTVHILPKEVEWYSGPIASALTSSQVLVTEIPMSQMKDPAVQQAFVAKAMLPEGQSLRGLLNPQQRTTYEAALAKLGLPAEAFDKVEPWFAALTLTAIPLIKAGYTLEAGVENAIEGKVGTQMKRAALETAEGQLKMFDEMPQAAQIAYLMSLVEQMDQVVPSLNKMVSAWAKGDADGLAKLMNEELDDPVLADRLLHARNRNWAEWVETRLADPGTVFVAVGAGHLAGEKSVQDYLGKEGLTVTRVQ